MRLAGGKLGTKPKWPQTKVPEQYRKIKSSLQGLQKDAGNFAQKVTPSDDTDASLSKCKPGAEVEAHY